jgi:hypothetical protein
MKNPVTLAVAAILSVGLFCWADSTNKLPGWLPGVDGKPTQTDLQIFALAHRVEALQISQEQMYREVTNLRARLDAMTKAPGGRHQPEPLQSDR